MIDIGYLNDSEQSEFSSRITAICNLEEVQPTKVSPIDSEYVKYCPSIKTLYANTFEVRCPFDLEFTIQHNGDGTWNWNINKDRSTIDLIQLPGDEILNFTSDGKVVQIYPNPRWSFISDTKNVILLQHSNGITTNPPIISGQVDIYKWPDRPLSVGYHISKNTQTFRLRRGQPWYNLTFITPEFEPIKLIRMYERCAFLKNTHNKFKLPTINKLDWRNVFNYFGRTRPKKLINN